MRIAAHLLPLVLFPLIGAGCGPAITQRDLNWLETANEGNRYVSLSEAEERLGPSRAYDPRRPGAVALPGYFLGLPNVRWKIWGDEAGDFIVVGYDERGEVYHATGRAGH